MDTIGGRIFLVVVTSSFIVFLICTVIWFILVLMCGSAERAEREERIHEEKIKREANAISRIKNVFNEAGYSPSDVEKLTGLAVVMLKEGTTYGDWTAIGPTKLMTTVQAAATLLGKKPPGST